MKLRVVALLVGCAGVAACASPEATRHRGGGPGGDVNNRPATVRMHGGSYEYYKTPQRIPVEHPSLDPAEQAKTVQDKPQR